MKKIIIVFLLLLLFSFSLVQALPAFPGAEGFGEDTIGGRGGTVYLVTNLQDSGTGSLRACVEASGPRICIFMTGGTIALSSPLTIRNPYITITGQTAPGGGITLKKTNGGDVFSTQTHDVIIRYITARPGPGGENHGNQIAKNSLQLYNILIDHNTYSWGVDSNIETWYRVYDATIQWSIISEALDDSTHSKGPHSKGIMIGGYKGSESGGMGSEDISVHHNLMAHNGERNPLMQFCGDGQVINNIVYNPYWTFSHQEINCIDPAAISIVNWIGNYHKKGPDSTSNTDLKVRLTGGSSKGYAYVQGNIGPSRTSDSNPETDWVDASTSFITTIPAVAPAVTTTDAFTAYDDVLEDAGNNKGLNCDGTFFLRRDQIDTRVVNSVKNGNGRIIDDPSDVGGYITIATGTPCADSDNDGMPDVWETANGLNPNNAADNSGDADGDGYTNIEEYINGVDSGVVNNEILCTESDWTHSDGACQSTNTFTRTWTKISSCTSGVTHPPTETISCVYVPPRQTEDVNNDGLVNINDIYEMIKDFGKTSNFVNQYNDVNEDNIVNLKDLVIIAKAIA